MQPVNYRRSQGLVDAELVGLFVAAVCSLAEDWIELGWLVAAEVFVLEPELLAEVWPGPGFVDRTRRGRHCRFAHQDLSGRVQ